MSFVQLAKSADTNDSATNAVATAAFGAASTAANVIAGHVSWQGTLTTDLTSVTDGTNTYAIIDASVVSVGDSIFMATFLAQNIAGGGTLTVTAHFGTTVGFRRIEAVEYSSVATTGQPHKHAINHSATFGTGTDAVTSGAQTTTIAGCTIYGVAYDESAATIPSVGTGYTSRDTATWSAGDSWRVEDQVQASAGSVAATFTITGGTQALGAAMLALAPGGGGGTALAGAGTAKSAGSGALTTVDVLAAAGLAKSAGTGALTVRTSLAGAGLASATGSAALTLGSSGVSLVASGQALSSGSGALTTVDALAATGLAQAAGSGALTTQVPLAAAGLAQAAGSAAITIGSSGVSLAAAGLASAAGAGTLTTSVALASTGIALANGSAAMTIPSVFAAAGSVVAVGSGALTVRAALAAAGLANASGSGALALAISLVASGSAGATGSAALTTGNALSATGAAVSSGSAALTARAALAATGQVVSTGAALLSGPGVVLTASGQALASGSGTFISAFTPWGASGVVGSVGSASLTARFVFAGSGRSLGIGLGDLQVPFRSDLMMGNLSAWDMKTRFASQDANFIAMSAIGKAKAAASATLNTQARLVAVGFARSVGSAATLVTGSNLFAAGSTGASGSATLSPRVALLATGFAPATAAGTLTSIPAVVHFVAAGSNSAAGSGALTTRITLAAAGLASASASGLLSTVVRFAVADQQLQPPVPVAAITGLEVASAAQQMPAFGQFYLVGKLGVVGTQQMDPFVQFARLAGTGDATHWVVQVVTLPPFAQVATALSARSVSANAVFGAFGQVATLAYGPMFAAATQLLPGFGQTATINLAQSSGANQNLAAFAQVATAIVMAKLTGAQTMPPFGQSATVPGYAAFTYNERTLTVVGEDRIEHVVGEDRTNRVL